MVVALMVAVQAMIAVPDAVRKELDTLCAGWRLASVIPEVADEIRTRTPTWPPNLLPGDFNGDNAIDVAVLQECRGTVQLVVLLSRDGGFSREVLEKPEPHDPRQFLHLIRREYGHDAIGVEYEAVGGHVWVFRDGTWRSLPQ
jgi:hypothetical protein